jgi:hypothetical protein
MPKRIQRRRAKGWKMPPNTVYVGRPSKFGNPYSADGNWFHADGSPATPVELFAIAMKENRWGNRDDVRRDLQGRNLACWCPLDKPCHADVLLELANQ